jgi:hypothetical protein
MPELNVIDNPHNREVILGLMAVFGLYAEAWEKERFSEPKFSTEFDLGSLRTHPDLGGAMERGAAGLDYTGGLILGYHVLVNKTGVIFTVAMSMTFLAVRLPPKSAAPLFDPGKDGPEIKFGLGWTCADPWNQEQLHRMMIEALAYVDSLSASKLL